MNQQQVLYGILTFAPNREALIAIYLTNFEQTFHFNLSKKILLIVFNKLIKSEISTDELEEWASFVECRDEIHCDTYEDYIYALSNPALMNGDDMSSKKLCLLSEIKTLKVKEMLECLLLEK